MFDPKCLELAQHFIADTKCSEPDEYARRLAKDIQEAVEDFIDFNEEALSGKAEPDEDDPYPERIWPEVEMN